MRKIPIFLLLLFSISSLLGTVLIYGDTRNHPEVHQRLVTQVAELPFTAIFYTGDMNQKGITQREYDSFKQIIRPLGKAFYPVRGNHERDLELYLNNFSLPEGNSFYSLEHDALKYIVLDSNLDLLPGSRQYQWLTRELRSATVPIILLLHHPVFSSGYHGDELGLQWFLPNLLKDYPVLAVVSGHEHSFEHLEAQGTHYFVSGGGGAPLREKQTVDPHSRYFIMTHHYNLLHRMPQEILWQCFDLDGKMLYETRIWLPVTP